MGRLPPAPGRFVDVAGTPIHVVVRGDGEPVVVVASGLGGGVVEWGPVADLLSRTTKVVLYDRPGMGWSPYRPGDRSAVGVAAELHQVLACLDDVAPPFVLVGHSLGAFHVRAYAAAYPDNVASIVLVDPSHEDVFRDEPVARRANQVMAVLLRAASLLPGIGGRVLARPVTRALQASLTGPLSSEVRDLMRLTRTLKWGNPGWVRAMGDEVRALPRSDAQMRASREERLAAGVRLRIISQGRDERGAKARALAERFRRYHADLLALAPDSRQVLAGKSGHIVPLDQPQVIVDTVLELIGRSGP